MLRIGRAETTLRIGNVPTVRGDRDPVGVELVRIDGSPFPQVRLIWHDPDFVPGFTPARARQLAALLCQAADEARAKPQGRGDGEEPSIRGIDYECGWCGDQGCTCWT